jgi:hypothetical protein
MALYFNILYALISSHRSTFPAASRSDREIVVCTPFGEAHIRGFECPPQLHFPSLPNEPPQHIVRMYKFLADFRSELEKSAKLMFEEEDKGDMTSQQR